MHGLGVQLHLFTRSFGNDRLAVVMHGLLAGVGGGLGLQLARRLRARNQPKDKD